MCIGHLIFYLDFYCSKFYIHTHYLDQISALISIIILFSTYSYPFCSPHLFFFLFLSFSSTSLLFPYSLPTFLSCTLFMGFTSSIPLTFPPALPSPFPSSSCAATPLCFCDFYNNLCPILSLKYLFYYVTHVPIVHKFWCFHPLL